MMAELKPRILDGQKNKRPQSIITATQCKSLWTGASEQEDDIGQYSDLTC